MCSARACTVGWSKVTVAESSTPNFSATALRSSTEPALTHDTDVMRLEPFILAVHTAGSQDTHNCGHMRRHMDTNGRMLNFKER